MSRVSRPAAPPAAPESGRAARRRTTRRSGRRRFWIWTLSLLSGLILLGALAFAYLYTTTPIPKPNELAMAEASIVYYADGKTEMGRVGEVNRENVDLKDVPLHVRRAMLSAEDRDFETNVGVSPTGLARAVVNMLRGQSTQSGSTITQQYVKNYYLNQDQTLSRKLKELIISLKIDRELSKDQILENYLNTIYYGRGAYGIKTAARAYFGTTPDKLTVAQGALLASVINAPSLYDPTVSAANKARAQARVKYVLDGMLEKGWLRKSVRDNAKFPAVNATTPSKARRGPNGYLLDVAVDELVRGGVVSEDELNRGGLRVVTTIDAKMQQKAVDAVAAKRPQGTRGDQVHVALASVKPGDGAIVALYGGRDYAKQQFDDATQGHLQAGSTFKMFTLITALKQGISTKTIVDGRSSSGSDIPGFGGTKIKNFGGSAGGMMTIKQATATSNNIAYAHLNSEVGGDATKDTAVEMGLDPQTPGLNGEPINVLGTASVTPLDMARAFATIAAGGKDATPYIVRSMTSNDGRLSYTAQPVVKDVFSADVAADATDALRGVIEGGSGHDAAIGRPAAGKTGTSSSNKSAWFDGFVPQLATTVGLFMPDAKGNPQDMTNIDGRSEVTGGSFPAAIWREFMSSALDGVAVQDFPARVGIGDDKVSSTGATQSPDPSATASGTPSPSPSATGPTPIPTPSLSTGPGPAPSATPSDTPLPSPSSTPTHSTTPSASASPAPAASAANGAGRVAPRTVPANGPSPGGPTGTTGPISAATTAPTAWSSPAPSPTASPVLTSAR